MDTTTIIAIVTGVAGIITAIGGVLLAIRAVRSKERKAANTELKVVEGMLDKERHEHIESEVRLHECRMLLAQNGIPVPGTKPQ